MVWALPLAYGKRSGFSPFRANRAPFFRSLTVASERACGSWLQSLTQENILYFPYPFYQACNEINKKSAFKKLLKNYDIFLKIPKKI